MSSDNTQSQPTGTGTGINLLLSDNGIVPGAVQGSTEAADRIKARIDNTIGNNVATSQANTTEQTTVTGSVTDRSSFLESMRGRESEFLRNYREVPGVTVQSSIAGGITVSAIIPASYVEINPADGKPRLAGNGVQTIDENGKLSQNFRLSSTKLRQNENGTYTVTQNYNPKPRPSVISRTSAYAEYESNPLNRQSGTSAGLRITFGGGRTTLGPYVSRGNVTLGAGIPIRDTNYQPTVVMPSDIRVSMLLNVENTQKQNATNTNTNTQAQQEKNTVKPKRPVL
jgi:hypothetical protein